MLRFIVTVSNGQHYISFVSPVGPVGCWPALHRPCRPRDGILTLTDPRGGHFFKKRTGTNPYSWPYPTQEVGSWP